MTQARGATAGRRCPGSAQPAARAPGDQRRARDAGPRVPGARAVVPKHAQNEQLTYLLEGSLRFWLVEDGSEVVDLGAGEVLHIPSHLPHRAEALEKTLDVNIFCPPREDWLDGSDSYLRGS